MQPTNQQPQRRGDKSYETDAKRVLTEIQSLSVGVGNYQELFEKVKSQSDIISSVIESTTEDYQLLSEQYVSGRARDENAASMTSQTHVSRDQHELLKQMYNLIQKVFTFKTLQMELWSQLCKKFYISLGKNVALDVEKQVLEQRRAEVQTTNKLF